MNCQICGRPNIDNDTYKITMYGTTQTACELCNYHARMLKTKDFERKQLATQYFQKVKSNKKAWEQPFVQPSNSIDKKQHTDLFVSDNISFLIQNKQLIIKNSKYVIDRIPITDIIDCEIIERGRDESTGSFTKALIGDILFGPAGAFAGAQGKTKQIVTEIGVNILTSDISRPSVFFKLNDRIMQKTYIDYQECCKAAQEIRAAILAIVEQNRRAEAQRSSQTPSTPTQSKSTKKRLAELKELLDDGIITAEEYAAARQRILENL